MMASKELFECDNVPAEEGELISDMFNKYGIAGIQTYTKERLNKWREIHLHIAITGESGAGKSTFINVLRGLKSDEEGGAHTDVIEATETIESYKHPKYENVVFWDLPGVGTDNFKRENYDAQVKLAKYDFFLICSSERFSENDGWLAEKISNMGKKFYFLRTKVSVDISNDGKGRSFPRSRDDILNQIQSHCLLNLKKHRLSDSLVYLIDNFEPNDFDFNGLKAKLIEDTTHLKREAMVFSIIGQTEEIMFQKKKELEKRIKFISLASAVAGAVPIPFTYVDLDLVLKEIMFYRDQFGLTDNAIKKCAEMLGVQEEELKKELDMTELLFDCTMKGLLAFCDNFVISEVAQEVAKFLIPIIGSVTAGIISYKSTNYWLTKILEGLYQDALKIIRKLSMHSAQSSPF